MNIERPNQVERDEETGGIQHISMASRTGNFFLFYQSRFLSRYEYHKRVPSYIMYQNIFCSD